MEGYEATPVSIGVAVKVFFRVFILKDGRRPFLISQKVTFTFNLSVMESPTVKSNSNLLLIFFVLSAFGAVQDTSEAEASSSASEE